MNSSENFKLTHEQVNAMTVMYNIAFEDNDAKIGDIIIFPAFIVMQDLKKYFQIEPIQALKIIIELHENGYITYLPELSEANNSTINFESLANRYFRQMHERLTELTMLMKSLVNDEE